MGVTVEPANVDDLIAFGMAVKHAVERQVEVVHPLDPGLHGVFGTILLGRCPEARSTARHAERGRRPTNLSGGPVRGQVKDLVGV